MRVDFTFGATNRFRTSCEMLQTHYQKGRKLMVYLSDQRALAHFNRFLWGFQPTAFVPHALASDSIAAQTPIILCKNKKEITQAQEWLDNPWLLNLDHELPPVFPQSQRILEVVSTEEQCRQQARQRWRAYQAQGCELKAQELQRPTAY